ncbi:hypothetical protein SAMN04488061_2908 [Filomicrobium insigne]|uniref:Uncharacterized protein n=1 Tax=Filomicrobium insigne TaxID=418854 RepID=A0A1H0SIH3_9HYPH|nr:hypothetical protein SAMN04488061_2908 [Filomicrobium insigne]
MNIPIRYAAQELGVDPRTALSILAAHGVDVHRIGPRTRVVDAAEVIELKARLARSMKQCS